MRRVTADQVFTRAAILALALLAALLLAPRDCEASGDACDPVDGPRSNWTPEAKRGTRDRVQAACEAAGAAPIVCAYWDAVVVRESSGRASVVHRLGSDEDGTPELGLGAMGLSVRWHAAKWPGPAEDLCRPEVSFAVAHEIAHRAVSRYGAKTLVEVQAIYAGSWRCRELGAPRWWRLVPGLRWLAQIVPARRECSPLVSPRVRRGTCSRMASRGHDCRTQISAEDLGPRVELGRRRAWVEEL